MTPDNDPFFLLPLLSPEDVRLLGQVILASGASSEYGLIPSPDNLRRVINDCKDMMNNPLALERMMRSNRTEHAHLAFKLFLAMTANIQFPGQDPRPREKVGRLLALLESLPKSHPEKLTGEQARLVGPLLPKVEAFLGTSVNQLSICFYILMQWQAFAYLGSKRALSVSIGHSLTLRQPEDRQLILNALFEEDRSVDRFVVFSPGRIARNFIEPEARPGFHQQFRIFLGLFSATTGRLRQGMAERPEFQLGSISNRLSPLERFPIVRMREQGDEFSVPNVAHFLKSFAAIVDYTLLTEFGDVYGQARGALLELYVRCLVEDRLPHLVVIPELTYGREERRGPDLTLIDLNLRRIILIEVKGRRIRLSTRLNMEEEELQDNLDDAYSALQRLPRKLDDLYAGLPEYRAYQEAIDATRGSTPVFVAVLSEGVYFMGELVREMATQASNPLYNFPYPYCVLALDVFERAVEISRKNDAPLPVLLNTHFERSFRREYYSAGADSFDGTDIPESDTFASTFAPWEDDAD